MGQEKKQIRVTNSKLTAKTRMWPIVTFALLVTGAIAIYSFWLLHHPQQSSSPTTPVKIPAMTGVAALGRLTPQGEVIHLSAPTSLEAVQVAQLSVKEGDSVRAGEIVAILDGRDRLLAALERAQKQVKVFEARLQRVKAGTKTGEIEAQKEAIARLEAELDDARAQLTQTQANLELAYVRAPLDGEIIAIRTHPGEALSKQGIVDLGRTDRMIVVAEVNQNHISGT